MLHILLYSLKEAEKTAVQMKTIEAIEGPWGLSCMETTDNNNTNTRWWGWATPTNTSINTPTITTNTSTNTATKTVLPDQLAATPESHSHRGSSSQAKVLSCIYKEGVSCKFDAKCIIITSTTQPSDDTTSLADSTPTKATISPPTAKAMSEEQHCPAACNMQQQQPVFKQQQPSSYGFGAWTGRLNESLRSVGRFVSCGLAAWE